MLKIRNVLLTSAISVAAMGFASGVALASGPVTIVEQQPVTIAPARPAPTLSWEGFYAGLNYARVTGDGTETTTSTSADFESDNGFGVFAGYNWQRGNFVFGGELAYNDFTLPVVGFPGVEVENSLELRARAGYAFDRVMVYGFVGAARSDANIFADSISMTGYSYGIGAQALVTRNMFVGLELARRDIDGTYGAFEADAKIDTVSLRVGFQF